MKKKIFSSLFSSYLLLGCLTNTVMFESTLRAVEKPISLELNEKGDLKNLYKEVLSALEKQSLAADTSRKNSLKKDPNERIRKAFEEISEKEESRLVICQTIEKNMKNLKKNEKVKLRELIRRLLVLQGENSKFGELMKEKLDLKLDLNLILDDISDIGKVKAEKTQKFVLLLNGKDENRENLARIIVDFIVLAAKACLINGKDFQFSSFEVNMGNKGEKFIKLLSDVIFPKKADEVPSIPDTSAPSTSAFSSSMIFEASDSSKASFSEILKKLSAKVDEDKDIEDLKATFDKIFDQIKEKGETLDSFIPLKFKSEESRKNIYEVLIEELIEKAKKDKIDADEVKKFEELLRSMKSFFKDSDSKEDCVSLNKIMEESMNQTSIIIWANQKQIIFNDKKSEAIEEVICNIVDFIIMEIYECVSNFPVPDDKFLDIFDSINLVKWLSKIGHLTEKPSTEKMELKALLPLEEKADVSKSSPLIFPEIDHLIKKSSTGIELKVLSPLDRKADVSKSSSPLIFPEDHLIKKSSTEIELKVLLPLEEKADVSKSSSPLIFPEDHLIKKSSTGIELKVLSPLDRKADVSKSSPLSFIPRPTSVSLLPLSKPSVPVNRPISNSVSVIGKNSVPTNASLKKVDSSKRKEKRKQARKLRLKKKNAKKLKNVKRKKNAKKLKNAKGKKNAKKYGNLWKKITNRTTVKKRPISKKRNAKVIRKEKKMKNRGRKTIRMSNIKRPY